MSLRVAVVVSVLLVSTVSCDWRVKSSRAPNTVMAAVLSSAEESIKSDWLQLFHQIWLEKRDEVSWCLGSTESGAYNVIRRSLPAPLPSGFPVDDEMCSTAGQIGPYLCTAEQISEYYKVLESLSNAAKTIASFVDLFVGQCPPCIVTCYLPIPRPLTFTSCPATCLSHVHPATIDRTYELLHTTLILICFLQHILRTDNVEKLPDTGTCATPLEACGSGYFDSANTAASTMNMSAPVAHPCCEGYFCPPMLSCMMPCPLGAYCPR